MNDVEHAIRALSVVYLCGALVPLLFLNLTPVSLHRVCFLLPPLPRTLFTSHQDTLLLDDEQLDQIRNNDATRHPLFLRLLLNTLRTCGEVSCVADVFVAQRLEECLEVGTVRGLINVVITQWEKDVEMLASGADRGILGRVLGLLFVSHRGLKEKELWGALDLDENVEVRREAMCLAS